MQLRDIDVALARSLNKYVDQSKTTDIVIIAIASWFAYFLFIAPAFVLTTQEPQNGFHPILFIYGVAFFARLFIAEAIYYFAPRQRPSTEDGIKQLFPKRHASFPSGHAIFFTAIAVGMYMFSMPFVLLYSVGVLVMCIARVIAGVHYPSDILAGVLLGAGTVWICFKIAGV